MLAGLLCVLVLCGALLVRRSSPRVAAAPWKGAATRAEVLAGLGVVLVASSPILGLLPWISGNPPTSWGDGMTHARVASDVARHGIPHGWVDSYLGGFPFFHHYPPVGWVATVALVKTGVAPENATSLLGGLGVLAAPICVYYAAIWCGARPANAVPGALLVGWVAPYSPFVGGYEVFFQLGLLSQALGVPFAALLAAAIFRRGRAAPAVLLAALTMAVHPQIGVAALVVVGIGAVVAFDRDVMARWLRALAAGGVMGAALYGQGIRTMRLPFGWPKNKEWLQLGFPPERLSWWIRDGDLLDQDRVPILTALTIAAVFAAILLARRPAARGAAVAVVTAILLSVSGFALASSGAIGALLLAFLQPLRMVAMVPLAAAAVLIVTFEEGGALLDAARARLGRTALAAVTMLLLLALPSRVDMLFAKRALIAYQASPSSQPCGPATPAGYDHEAIRTWLANEPRERLWYAHDTSALRACALSDGMELLVPGPIAITGGVGAHVGLQWLAFRKLDIDRAGAGARADALGIRYVLRVEEAAVPDGFRVLQRSGSVSLLVHDAPAYGVGAGCIRETWSGSDRALRDEIERTLGAPAGADHLLDPRALVALDVTAGPVTKTPAAEDACTLGETEIAERAREPGALEATVKTDRPVDVVFRATAFPSWRVERDGAPLGPIRMVVPGFFAVRVPAGEHHLVATASLLPGFTAIVLGGLVVVVALALLDREGIAALRRRLRRQTG
jgi:hypothetical protein